MALIAQVPSHVGIGVSSTDRHDTAVFWLDEGH